jgi:hypothetical protein
MTMSVGRFILHRFNGDEEFCLKSATILALHDEEGIRLWFEAETDGVRVKSLPDTASLPASPKAEVAVTLVQFDPNKLVGERFSVPAAYDEKIEDHVANIYYVEHDDLNDNIIEILAQEGNTFHVFWTGTTTDVNYYDGGKPSTRVEIDGIFTFKDMQKWLPSPKRTMPLPAFSVGQRVRVILNERNKTLRIGEVRNVIWHHKDQRYNYYLEETGKKVAKRYFEEDLVAILPND